MKIELVTKDSISYLDESGNNQIIDLHQCNKNWIESHRRNGNEISELDHKYIGWRDVCGNPPYILLFTEPRTKFEFTFDSKCTVTDEKFWAFLEQLRKVGWRTIDLS